MSSDRDVYTSLGEQRRKQPWGAGKASKGRKGGRREDTGSKGRAPQKAGGRRGHCILWEPGARAADWEERMGNVKPSSQGQGLEATEFLSGTGEQWDIFRTVVI